MRRHSITNKEQPECHVDLWMSKYTLISRGSGGIPIFSVPTQRKISTRMALITCMDVFAASSLLLLLLLLLILEDGKFRRLPQLLPLLLLLMGAT